MSSRRQRNIPLGGRYRQVSLVSLCVGSSRKPNPCNLWSTQTFALSHHHDDGIKWKYFPRSPVNSPHEGQWRGALMFSLICVWINSWVNNCEAGDLRRCRAHYDVTVMIISIPLGSEILKISAMWMQCFNIHSILRTDNNRKFDTSIEGHISWCVLSVVVNGMSVQILFVWSPWLIWWFSGPFSRRYPSATMTHWIYTFKAIWYIVDILHFCVYNYTPKDVSAIELLWE